MSEDTEEVKTLHHEVQYSNMMGPGVAKYLDEAPKYSFTGIGKTNYLTSLYVMDDDTIILIKDRVVTVAGKLQEPEYESIPKFVKDEVAV